MIARVACCLSNFECGLEGLDSNISRLAKWSSIGFTIVALFPVTAASWSARMSGFYLGRVLPSNGVFTGNFVVFEEKSVAACTN